MAIVKPKNFLGTSEQVPFAVIWHLRDPVATGEVKSLLMSDPGFFRDSLRPGWESDYKLTYKEASDRYDVLVKAGMSPDKAEYFAFNPAVLDMLHPDNLFEMGLKGRMAFCE